MKGCSELVDPGPHGRKVGKLLRKNMRKPHFRGREGRKATNRPRAVGVPVSFARTFCVPSCFGRCRGTPSYVCVLSPPGPPWVFCACDSSPCRALIFAQHPKNATNFYICARDSRFAPPPNPPWPPIAPPSLLLHRTPAVQKTSWVSSPGIIPQKFSKFQIGF
jgi:hypothetical protein